MISALLPLRGVDAHGSGAFGASRGRRKHNGVDFVAPPATLIFSPVSGVVTRLGFPYADDTSYRYVEVTDAAGTQHRLFYIEPLIDMGERVTAHDVIGEVQDLTTRYPGITNHVHYEIRRGRNYSEAVTI